MQDLFLATITRLGGSASSSSLRKALALEPDAFKALQKDLIAAGKLIQVERSLVLPDHPDALGASLGEEDRLPGCAEIMGAPVSTRALKVEAQEEAHVDMRAPRKATRQEDPSIGSLAARGLSLPPPTGAATPRPVAALPVATSFSALASFIWGIADLLRGEYKQSEYGRVILPLTLLRRLECVLEPKKAAILAEAAKRSELPEAAREKFLRQAAGLGFFNSSELSLAKLSSSDTRADLKAYLAAFSAEAREIFDNFELEKTIDRLHAHNLLYLVLGDFAKIDLSPAAVDNPTMGLIFEELIRKFAEISNETAGEHFTPRDIVRLTTALVLEHDDEALSRDGVIRTVYDPTCGTGGFLSSGMEYAHEINPKTKISVYGQELNAESYAICKADMLIKGQDPSRIHKGNTLSEDKLPSERFDYMLANPPFGVEWKKVETEVKKEANRGFAGRFGPGLPRISDGSLLFLLHLVAKMKPAEEGGSRIGIILNGSPLFTGGPASGESEIRRHLLERDLVESIVALPTDMFYNTGIATYIWILSSAKSPERRGQVLLVNASSLFVKMKKSLGSKRQQISEAQIEEIVRLAGVFTPGPLCKIFPTTAFGYRQISIERPLRLSFAIDAESAQKLADSNFPKKAKGQDEAIAAGLLQLLQGRSFLGQEAFTQAVSAELKKHGDKLSSPALQALIDALGQRDPTAPPTLDAKGLPEPDAELRDSENVPLGQDIQAYFRREVLPHAPDAWIDLAKRDARDGQVGIVGYEIPFNRHFYQYQAPRSLDAIDAELQAKTSKIMELLREITR